LWLIATHHAKGIDPIGTHQSGSSPFVIPQSWAVFPQGRGYKIKLGLASMRAANLSAFLQREKAAHSDRELPPFFAQNVLS
jgi:hypothetical protein